MNKTQHFFNDVTRCIHIVNCYFSHFGRDKWKVAVATSICALAFVGGYYWYERYREKKKSDAALSSDSSQSSVTESQILRDFMVSDM